VVVNRPNVWKVLVHMHLHVVGEDGQGQGDTPAAPTSIGSPGDGGRVDMATRDAVIPTIEREVLTVALFAGEVYLMKATPRRRYGPQLALEPMDLAGVECQHPARGALQDGFSSSGVPMIIR